MDRLDAYLTGARAAALDRLCYVREQARLDLQTEDEALLDAWVRGYLGVIAELLAQCDGAHGPAALQIGPGHGAPLRPAGHGGCGRLKSQDLTVRPGED